MEEKDIFIGELKQHLGSEAGEAKRPKFKRTKFLGKLSPGGLALFVIAITVSAVLGGFFYSFMVVQLEGDVDISGRTITSVFKWDGENIVGDTLNVPLDITEISNGEYQVFFHNVSNEDMGNWMISINQSSMEEIYSNESHPFYGFSLVCTPDSFVLGPGSHQDIMFNYSTNHEMMDPELFGSDDGILHMSISVEIEEFIDVILAVDDSVTLQGINNEYEVLLNDDCGLQGVMITSVDGSLLPSDTTVTIAPDGQSVLMTTGGTQPRPWTFSYEITSNASPWITDEATVTITS